jgi:hypothetical protein
MVSVPEQVAVLVEPPQVADALMLVYVFAAGLLQFSPVGVEDHEMLLKATLLPPH